MTGGNAISIGWVCWWCHIRWCVTGGNAISIGWVCWWCHIRWCGTGGCYQTSNFGGCVGGVTLGGVGLEDAIRLVIWVGALVVSH